jgi:putative ABC transport system ATP-binding protein
LTGNDTAVAARGVTKDFDLGDGSRLRVLADISFTMPAGKLAMLSGPSGCGKTTLICIISGILKASIGEVSIFGQALNAMDERDRTAFRLETIGFVFQQSNLIPALSVRENAAVPLIAAGCSRTAALERATDILDRLGIGEFADSRPIYLSGGQQQRATIARALVHEPRLVLCDEPTSALDAESGRALMGLLRSIALQPDRGVIVVTHDSRIVEFADQLIMMEDGRIKSADTIGQRGAEAFA